MSATPKTKTPVIIAGASGRMGRALVRAALSSQSCNLAAALVRAGNPLAGCDAAAFLGLESGVRLNTQISEALAQAGAKAVFIEFTRPDSALQHVRACQAAGIGMVIGTTGFTAEQRAEIQRASQHIAICLAPNMSRGVQVALALTRQAAALLGADYDAEILEAHHALKKDAPSGTALALGTAIAQARQQELTDSAIYARQGQTGARPKGSIGFSVIRGGDVVGEHTVLFIGAGERLEITHRSNSRAAYAQGSLDAARFISDKRSGLFDMSDVFGLPKAAA